MTRQKSLLEAIWTFHRDFGDDAERYLNIDSILADPKLVAQLQVVIEESIERDYLPGFRFRDPGRFLWHLKHEQFYRRFLFGTPIPQTYFRDHWVRRFLVPDRFHYVTEVADALQRKGLFSRELAHRQGRPHPRVRWLHLMGEWMQIKDVEVGLIRTKGRPDNWAKVYTATTQDTFLQWARKAKGDRRKRKVCDPPNLWQIDAIIYNGGQLKNTNLINQHVAMIDTGYLEVWKWMGDDGCAAPNKHRLSFMLPAGPTAWSAPDRFLKV